MTICRGIYSITNIPLKAFFITPQAVSAIANISSRYPARISPLVKQSAAFTSSAQSCDIYLRVKRADLDVYNP